MVQKTPFGCPFLIPDTSAVFWETLQLKQGSHIIFPVGHGGSQIYFPQEKQVQNEIFSICGSLSLPQHPEVKHVWRDFFFSEIAQYKIWFLSKALLYRQLSSLSILP